MSGALLKLIDLRKCKMTSQRPDQLYTAQRPAEKELDSIYSPPQPAPPLTRRQLQCLYWVMQGKSANDIGGILGISGRTVEDHLVKACSHFDVRSRHQAAWIAYERGYLRDLDP